MLIFQGNRTFIATPLEPYLCPYCDMRFANTRQLDLHVLHHTQMVFYDGDFDDFDDFDDECDCGCC